MSKKASQDVKNTILETATVTFMVGALDLASQLMKPESQKETMTQEPKQYDDSFERFDHFHKPK